MTPVERCHPAYAAAILEVYGQVVQPERQGPCGRFPLPYKVPPKGLVYATVHKTRENNRVVAVETRLIYGNQAALKRALKDSAVSDAVNTVFVERQNGTDRNRNARKVRKTYCFSKDWDMHEAVTYFTTYSANQYPANDAIYARRNGRHLGGMRQIPRLLWEDRPVERTEVASFRSVAAVQRLKDRGCGGASP